MQTPIPNRTLQALQHTLQTRWGTMLQVQTICIVWYRTDMIGLQNTCLVSCCIAWCWSSCLVQEVAAVGLQEELRALQMTSLLICLQSRQAPCLYKQILPVLPLMSKQATW